MKHYIATIDITDRYDDSFITQFQLKLKLDTVTDAMDKIDDILWLPDSHCFEIKDISDSKGKFYNLVGRNLLQEAA